MSWSAIALLLISIATVCNGSFLHNSKLENGLASYHNAIRNTTSSSNTQLSEVDAHYALAASQPSTTSLVNINARSYAVYDRTSAQVVASKAIEEQVPIASLTKLMTTLVIIQNHKANEKITVPHLPKFESDVAVAGIKEGETYTVGDLISAVLVASSADAATALAIWDSKTEAAFVAKMNDTAQYWGLTHTHYANVVGLDDPQNYSSAQDLVKIVSVLLQSKTIASTVDKKSIFLTAAELPTKTLYTTNMLLGQNGIVGVKTGTTALAGQCFIGRYVGQNKDIITIVLGSTNRFGDTQNMLNYTFKSVNWI